MHKPYTISLTGNKIIRMKTQAEITTWEHQNKDAFDRWEIEYGYDFDMVTFYMRKTVVATFNRIKTKP